MPSRTRLGLPCRLRLERSAGRYWTTFIPSRSYGSGSDDLAIDLFRSPLGLACRSRFRHGSIAQLCINSYTASRLLIIVLRSLISESRAIKKSWSF